MKKGFIFSMDAFLAIILFVLVIFLIYTFSVSLSGLNQQYFFSDDLLTSFAEIKIKDLNLDNYPQIKQLVSEEKIKDLDATLTEQIVTFYEKNENDNARKIADDVIKNINKDLSSALYIGEEQIYGGNPANVNNILARTRLAVGKKKI